MIQLASLTKSYGKQHLFEDASIILSPGDRVGLVGRNGSGKSTLLKLVLKEEEPDSGQIIIPKDYKIGHLSQHLVFTEPNILEEACLGLPLLDEGWKETYKAEAMLMGLGFSTNDFTKPVQSFSGGFQIRINLAKLLLSEPNLLLLDEPTNYLDVTSIRWLREFLQNWPHELILITHDREFLDSVITHTMTIHREKIRKIPGSSIAMMELLATEEELYEKTRVNEEKKREDLERFINRFRAKASKAKSVQSRVKALEKMDVKEKLNEIKSLDFEFRSVPFPSKWMMDVKNISFRYADNLPWLIKDLNFSVGKTDRIAIIGQNGRGKTTLLKLLAGEMKPTQGEVTWNSNTMLSHFGQTNINRLDLKRTVESELMSVNPEHSRTMVRSVAGAMMFEGDSALKQISVLSGGERSRVLLGKILLKPSNLLLLDEPTNHLDMDSIDCLMEAIDIFDGAVVIVTHSEMIIRSLATRLVVFDGDEAFIFEGTYDDFLERIGWKEDLDTGFSNSIEEKPATVEKKTEETPEKKRENSKKTSKIEKAIIEREDKMKELKAQLEEASNKGDLNLIRDLGTKFAFIEKEVEDLFEELSQIS
ncbi:MAG: ABC-F family ATP-binding cassette domain-containing protein [Proteobacteria bacterium]|nr:ABC-F family ATP-binding cassette domain-containing protein [Pseudomonadota bacterium]